MEGLQKKQVMLVTILSIFLSAPGGALLFCIIFARITLIMAKQIIIIHGGTTFDTYEEYLDYLKSVELTLEKIQNKDWKDNLVVDLPDYQILYPKMPNSKNARYEEWKIWFEKMIPLMEPEVILIGHSLGAIFLAKYLSENTFPKKIASLHLVAGPYDDKDCDEPLADFSLSGPVYKLSTLTSRLFLYQSKDDPVVPFVDLFKYQKDLPEATSRIFEDRGHFNQEQFPEIVEDIKSLWYNSPYG